MRARRAAGSSRGSADVFVTASEFETQGLTVIEAMACGAPVALADVPVFRPLVDAGAAVAFSARDPADVARGILRAHAEREALHREGARVAAASGTRASAERLLALYAAAAAPAARQPNRYATTSGSWSLTR